MLVTFEPEGSDKKVWVFDPMRVKSARSCEIERKWKGEGGDPGTYAAWIEALNVQGSAIAERILLWYLLRYVDCAKVQYQDVDPLYGEIVVERGVAELRQMMKIIKGMKIPEENEGERAEQMKNLDEALELAIARERELLGEVSGDPTPTTP